MMLWTFIIFLNVGFVRRINKHLLFNNCKYCLKLMTLKENDKGHSITINIVFLLKHTIITIHFHRRYLFNFKQMHQFMKFNHNSSVFCDEMLKKERNSLFSKLNKEKCLNFINDVRFLYASCLLYIFCIFLSIIN